MSEIQIVRVTKAAVVVDEIDFDRLLEQARESEKLRTQLSQRLQDLEELRADAHRLGLRCWALGLLLYGDKGPQAPIAKVIVREDGPANVVFYAPGLPLGEHDLYCAPEKDGRYLTEHPKTDGLEKV